MSPEDTLAVRELIELHGHIADAGAFDRYDELLTPDVTYDVTDMGGTVIEGLDALAEASRALGDGNPVGHHVTNVVLRQVSVDEVAAWSKGIGIGADGNISSVVYLDRVVRTEVGWRIAHRTVLGRREPLAPYRLPGQSSAGIG
jgi:hypothetical protein